MFVRKFVPLGILLIVMLTLAGCPGGGGGGAAQTMDIKLTDFAIEPKEINVNKGKVTFRVINAGPSVHNFTIDGVPGARTQDLEAGANENKEITFDKAGTYTAVCTVPGHKESGMVANVTVK